MQVTQEFFIGFQAVGNNYEMTNKAFLEAMTNVTNIHGNLVGQGINGRGKSFITWVVLNWKLKVFKRPKLCETITARTWGREYTKIMAFRDYDILNENGEIIAKATSIWIALDTQTCRPVKLTDDIMSGYKCEPQHRNFPEFEFSKSVKKDLPIVSETRLKINKSVIDCNNHVHNSAYMDLVNEVLPEGMNEINFNNIEINYRKEIKLHEDVLLQYATDGIKNYVFIWDENKRILHASIVMY